MEMIKKAVKATLGLILVMGSSGFAQSTNDALIAIDAEQYQKAKTILKGLISSKPAEGENYFLLGNVYLKQDYADSAKATFNKGIAADAGNELNYVGLGSVELDAGNASAAQAHFDKATASLKKKDYLPYVYVGRAYIDAPKPDYEKAITFLEKAKAVNPKDAKIYLALGDAYLGQKKNSEAYSAYRTAFELDNTLLRAKIALGLINKGSQAWKESIDEFNNVLTINPNYAPAYRELAETSYQWAKTDPKEWDAKIKQALDYYKKYIDLTDRSVESRMRYADFLILAKDYKTLQQEAEAMAKLDKANPRIYRYLGYAAYENGNYPASLEAIKNFMSKVDSKRLIGLDYLYLGQAQLKADSTATVEGFKNIKKAIELDSTNVEVMSEIAKGFYDAKRYPEAQQAYELAITNPDSKTDLNDHLNLGLSYYYDYAFKAQGNKNPDKALLTKADSAISYVIQKAPTTEILYVIRARIKRLSDDTENPKGLMVPDYEKYIEMVTAKGGTMSAGTRNNLKEAYNNLGAYYIKSDIEKAKSYLRKTVELDPQDSYAPGVLKQIEQSNK